MTMIMPRELHRDERFREALASEGWPDPTIKQMKLIWDQLQKHRKRLYEETENGTKINSVLFNTILGNVLGEKVFNTSPFACLGDLLPDLSERESQTQGRS